MALVVALVDWTVLAGRAKSKWLFRWVVLRMRPSSTPYVQNKDSCPSANDITILCCSHDLAFIVIFYTPSQAYLPYFMRTDFFDFPVPRTSTLPSLHTIAPPTPNRPPPPQQWPPNSSPRSCASQQQHAASSPPRPPSPLSPAALSPPHPLSMPPTTKSCAAAEPSSARANPHHPRSWTGQR